MLQVGYRPDTTMIGGNQQPDSSYRTSSSHLMPNTPASSDPRSSAYATPSSSSSSGGGGGGGGGASSYKASIASRHVSHHSHSHSQHSNSSPHNPNSHPHHAASLPVSAPPSIHHASDTRQTSPGKSRRSSQEAQPLPQPIKLRDLSHVVELAQEDVRNQSRSPAKRSRRTAAAAGGTGKVGEEIRRYEISEMPVGDVIEMVASLLTKITTTNDRQHQDPNRTVSPSSGNNHANSTTTSILAFHGKNIPSITIQSYLSRIHKYCPTSYEVFLSLLVYFDRMTEKVNRGPLEKPRNTNANPSISTPSTAVSGPAAPEFASSSSYPPSHFFVVDSFNIHRLVIAGVTCASKFFSDIFYTNSRYAKVGGLPLVELNHLELQFLILNDFRLAVPVEELEAYGTMLVSFYAREAVANANLQAMSLPPQSNSEHQNSANTNLAVPGGGRA